MSKRLAVLFALLTVSVASAATLKMKEFDNPPDPNMDGVATLHYVPGLSATKIHITITGFNANTTYGVKVGGQVDAAIGISTNPSGNGEINLSNGGDLTLTAQTIIIYLDDNNDNEYTPGEEVATGMAQ